mmetsp:Transcript_6327/g.21654  ORF Transcript_6327/g.21654 Transcript_6327/m.21654 type:complete len:318 (-) Transcript_6327:200-1153(-)
MKLSLSWALVWAPCLLSEASGPGDVPVASPLSAVQTFVIGFATSDRRTTFAKIARKAGIERVEFVDSINANVSSSLGPWVRGRTFDHLKCDQWKVLARKKVAVWASQLLTYKRAAQYPGLSLVVEEDVILFPTLRKFRAKLGRVLRSLRDRVYPRQPWDVVFLGSCLENLTLVEECHHLGDNTFLSRAAKPNCAHGLLLSQQGAAKFASLLGGWGDEYYNRSLTSIPPTNCSQAPHIEVRGKAQVAVTVRGARMKQFWKIYDGQDAVIRDKILSGEVVAYHSWPQLIMQRGRWGDHTFSYGGERPKACSGELPPLIG